MLNRPWSGVWAAMPTPFKLGQVDLNAVKKMTQFLLSQGVHGLSPCGTTGEGSSLEEKEFAQVLEAVLTEVNGKVPVAPGTGSNNTHHTTERVRLAKSLGAPLSLVVTPYYVKPTQDGIVRHYAHVSDKVDLPIILYNVPGRTAVNALPETVERTCKEANVVAVKECASLPQAAEVIERIGHKVTVLSGEDNMLVPFLAIGGQGMISVVANAFPAAWVEIYSAYMSGKTDAAKDLFMKHRAWTDLMFIETNPLPIKFLLSKMGLMSDEVRLPLSALSEKSRTAIETLHRSFA